MSNAPFDWGSQDPTQTVKDGESFNPWINPTQTPGEWLEWLKSMLEIDPPLFHTADSTVGPCCAANAPTQLAIVTHILATGSWYGCGDGFTTNGSTVQNFGAGADATFSADAFEVVNGTPGTVGDPVPWSQVQDTGSYASFSHADVYPSTPHEGVEEIGTLDTITTASDFSVNLWCLVDLSDSFGYTMFHHQFAASDSYYQTMLWGRSTSINPATGLGIFIGSDIATNPKNVTAGDPRPAQSIGFTICDGSGGSQSVSIGAGVDDGGWHMITATFETASQTMKIYLDGALIDTAVYAGSPVLLSSGTSNAPLIGCATGGCNFAGTIDEVAVLPAEALVGGDIATLFAG